MRSHLVSCSCCRLVASRTVNVKHLYFVLPKLLRLITSVGGEKLIVLLSKYSMFDVFLIVWFFFLMVHGVDCNILQQIK